MSTCFWKTFRKVGSKTAIKLPKIFFTRSPKLRRIVFVVVRTTTLVSKKPKQFHVGSKNLRKFAV